ncbi:MAG: hypothetical protein DYG97_10235 [Ignavibacteria bacterium CHB3]|nr:hypothetical protein [Ignavibacteria bacterium CHB3]
MSWEFKRDEDYLRERQKVVNELNKIDLQVRDILLADFLLLYNAWNVGELLKALKAISVEDEQTGSQTT